MKRDYKELKVGREFDLHEYEGKRLLLKEWTRTIVTVAVLTGCLMALALAYVSDKSGAVQSVWNATSVLIGGVIGYYLRGSRQSVESDD